MIKRLIRQSAIAAGLSGMLLVSFHSSNTMSLPGVASGAVEHSMAIGFYAHAFNDTADAMHGAAAGRVGHDGAIDTKTPVASTADAMSAHAKTNMQGHAIASSCAVAYAAPSCRVMPASLTHNPFGGGAYQPLPYLPNHT